MKKETKRNKILQLSNHLTEINPSYSNIFLCPICLAEISFEKLDMISEAHIIPKAAYGKLKTFLCVECNSQFGANQDKWFGDISILHKENKHILEKEIKGRYFYFDGKKVSGKWFTRENGNLAFVIYGHRNSPADLNHFLEYCKSSKIQFSVEHPLFTKNEQIKQGYLTAAYLFMFSIFGYSWVFQSYLDPIRMIILAKDKIKIKNDYFIFISENCQEPWIGLSKIESDTYFVFGFNNVLTLLPTISNPDVELTTKIKEKIAKNILRFNLNFCYENTSLHMVWYYQKLLILVDTIDISKKTDIKGLLLTEDKIELLSNLSEDKFNTMTADKNLNVKKIIINRT